jgi:hypothetical protein
VRTTIDIPEPTFEQAKRLAEAKGITVEQLVAEALEQRLRVPPTTSQKAWMRGFGALADLREESDRMKRVIEEEFEQIDPEDRQ